MSTIASLIPGTSEPEAFGLTRRNIGGPPAIIPLLPIVSRPAPGELPPTDFSWRPEPADRDPADESPEFDADLGGAFRDGRIAPEPPTTLDDALMVSSLKDEARRAYAERDALRRELADLRAVLARAVADRDRRAGELRDCRQAKAASELAAAASLFRMRNDLRRAEAAAKGE